MHSLIATVHFQPKEAWMFNPAGIVLASYLVFQIFGRSLVLASVLNAGSVSLLACLLVSLGVGRPSAAVVD